MRFLFVRHGETDWNIERKVQGTTDVPLNSNGLRQAELLLNTLKEMDVNPKRVYSSYQQRAYKTASILAEGLSLPVHVIKGLEEMSLGKFEGHTWPEIETLFPTELERWHENKRYNKAPEGESYQLVMERLFKAIDEILLMESKETANDILIVTHGAVIMTLLAMKNNIPFSQSHTIEVENAKPIIFTPGELDEIRRLLMY